MAKSKRPKRKAAPEPPQTSGYDRIRATVDEEGQLSMQYRVTGADRDGSHSHDEDVSSWADGEILALICQLISVDPKFKDEIQLERY